MIAAWDWNIRVKQEMSSWIGGFLEEETKMFKIHCQLDAVVWPIYFQLGRRIA